MRWERLSEAAKFPEDNGARFGGNEIAEAVGGAVAADASLRLHPLEDVFASIVIVLGELLFPRLLTHRATRESKREMGRCAFWGQNSGWRSWNRLPRLSYGVPFST